MRLPRIQAPEEPTESEQPMTTPNTDLFEALDWNAYSCQCTQHRHPCPNRATHIVHIHAISACDEPGLADGDRVELRCAECVLRLQAELHYRLMKLNTWGLCACATCGAPVVEVGDVVRAVEELK